MPPVYLDPHNLRLAVLDALLLVVEIDSGLVSPSGQKDLWVAQVLLVELLALDTSLE